MGRGKILKGKKHGAGGIDSIKPDGTYLEIESGEIIINAAASKKHCHLLSEINQSAGNGIAFNCDDPALDGIQGPMAAKGAKIENNGILTNKDVRTGIVLVSKWEPSLSFFTHAGIISIENGTPYVYDNDPDNKLNNKGGSIARVTLDEYLETKRVVQFYDSGVDSERIKRISKKLWDKKFNWVSFNCETFIKYVTGKPIKREVLMPIEQLGLVVGSIALGAFIAAGKGSKMENNYNHLIGRFVELSILGSVTPSLEQIKDIKVTPKEFEYRFVSVSFSGKGKFNDYDRIPLVLMDNFMDGKPITLTDSKNEPYILELLDAKEMFLNACQKELIKLIGATKPIKTQVADNQRNALAIVFENEITVDEMKYFNSLPNILSDCNELYDEIELVCDHDHKTILIPFKTDKAGSGTQIASSIKSELDKAVSDLHLAETMQKKMKDANAIIRSKKNVEKRLSDELGFSETMVRKIMSPDYAGRTGFPSFKLTNNNANIKRLKERVKMLEDKVKGAKAAESGKEQKYTFDGGSIEVNYSADRVQIFFDSIPTSEKRTELKRNGYKWSPSNKAWQRKITPQAIRNAVGLMKAQAETQLEKGIKVEQEHKDTLEKIASGKLTVDEAIEKTAKDHLKEDPEYYSKLETIEPNTNEEFDNAIIEGVLSELAPGSDWIGNIVKEGNVRRKIYDSLVGPEEEKLMEAQRLLGLLKAKVLQTRPFGDVINKSYANQYELNKAIESFVTLNGDSHTDYSAEEKNFIRKYSGYGGLDKYGPTGKGGLFEYYTPTEVIEKMWALAYKYGYNNGPLCEPSVGTGEFLQFAKPDIRQVGFEINEYSARIAKILYPTAEIKTMPFEQHFIKGNYTMKGKTESLEKFDLVIGNPPYGDFSIVASRYMTGMGEKDYTKAHNYVEYFIRRGIDLLNPKGLLIFIVGAQVKNGGKLFLDSGTSPVKEYLNETCTLLDAYRLPDSIFERTGVTSEIIVIQKN